MVNSKDIMAKLHGALSSRHSMLRRSSIDMKVSGATGPDARDVESAVEALFWVAESERAMSFGRLDTHVNLAVKGDIT